MNRSTDDQRSTQSSSPGLCQTEWKAAHCEMSAPQPETSSPTTPSTSNLPNRTSSTQGPRPSSPTRSGSRFCRVSPSTLTQYSADGTQLNMTPKVTHDIGDFTISTREATTSKSVKTAGDWFIAWNQAAAATTFAFPHRCKECQEYGRHILDLFAAFAEEHHRLILNYDRAVRKRVALRRNLLLTDLAEFGDLRVQFLDVRGANSGLASANEHRTAIHKAVR
jgi:hypothetical protein